MTRRIARGFWLLFLAAGFVLACGAGRATAAGQKEKVIVKHKEKGEKDGPRKIIKVIKAGEDCCPGFEWYGKKKRGFLGVQLLKLTEELRSHFGADKDAGVLIAKVEKDSPALKAGMQVGDILTEVDGQKVKNIHQVIRLIGKKKEGEQAKLKVVRQGKHKTLTATIQERERSQVEVSRFIRKLPGGGEEVEVEVNDEALEGAMERAHEFLEKYHWDDEGGHGFMFKAGREMEQRSKEMEQRLKEMEQRLKELEKKLQGKLRKKTGRRTT